MAVKAMRYMFLATTKVMSKIEEFLQAGNFLECKEGDFPRRK